MGDHPGFIVSNPFHAYKRVSTDRSDRSSPYKQTKQLMAIISGLKLNNNKKK